MAICGTCQTATSRLRTIMTDDRGRLLPEDQRKDLCPHCAPHEFNEPFWTPFERKIWRHEDAYPHLYTQLPNGTWTAKDEVSADTLNEISQDPEAEQREKLNEHKRRVRRTTPATAEEIQAQDNAWRPIVQEMQQRHDEDMKAYNAHLDEKIEKYVGRIQ